MRSTVRAKYKMGAGRGLLLLAAVLGVAQAVGTEMTASPCFICQTIVKRHMELAMELQPSTAAASRKVHLDTAKEVCSTADSHDRRPVSLLAFAGTCGAACRVEATCAAALPGMCATRRLPSVLVSRCSHYPAPLATAPPTVLVLHSCHSVTRSLPCWTRRAQCTARAAASAVSYTRLAAAHPASCAPCARCSAHTSAGK